MKVLWLCNVELPIISKHLNKSEATFGGWLNQMSYKVIENNFLFVMYPNQQECNGQIDNLYYQSFTNCNTEKNMTDFIIKSNPDIIHIWGTEFEYSNVFIKCVEKAGYIDKCVISIQGLVSVYASHYVYGVPESVVKRFTLRDLIKQNNIYLGKEVFVKRGKYEIDTLRRAKHIIGRTEWDKACTLHINKKRKYYFCNETLRPAFYEKKWDIDGIKRHSIFVSQCNYPIKGFHELLKMLPRLKKIYPDIHVFTTGKDLLHLSIKDKIMITSYQKYLLELIKHNGLENNITFLGMLSEKEMRDQYLSAHVFVSPSSIENSPNSVGESMLVGCPTVASSVGGTMDMLCDKKEGFLYQPTAPYMMAYYIGKIFDNDDLAINISINASKHAEKTHDGENNFLQLMTIYNEIANK